jgi:hypothetical protein
MTTLRAVLFAAMFALPAAAAAAPDEQAAECRSAARDEPLPHDARDGDPREARRDPRQRRDEAAKCAGAGWRARIPGMLR